MAAAELISAAEVLEAGEARVGGKALGLARLVAAGARVPPFLVVPAEHLADFLDGTAAGARVEAELAALEARDADGPEFAAAVAAAAERIGSVFGGEPPPALRSALNAALSALGPGPFAVRSSLVGEDSARHSFAGQLDSFLFQPAAGVAPALVGCWRSAFGVRALAYRRQARLPLAAVRMGVVVQQMVDGQVSGVLFTAHPLSGDRRRCLVSAAWGHGQGIVAGAAADEFVWSHGGAELATRVAHKARRLVRSPNGAPGLVESDVPPPDRDRRSLTPAEVDRVCREGVRVAALLGPPQDIEWTLAGDDLYLLQSRPVTSLPERAAADGPLRVWDNSNIQESYCGVTTPLTFSFAAAAYATVYEQTMRAVGLPQRVVEAHRPLLRNLLGLVRGRIYYNIHNWYRGLLLLPFVRRNKADMERMMGLTDPVGFIEDESPGLGRRLRRAPRLALTLARLLVEFARLRRTVPRFLADFEEAYRRVDRAALAEQGFARLIEVLGELRRGMLENWHTPILNDFRVMMANGRLCRLLERAGVTEPAVLTDLLAGEGREATEPTRELLALAAEARREPALARALGAGTAAEAFERVRRGWPDFGRRIDAYVERYGDRVMGELKLETVTLRQDRGFLRRVLRDYVDREDLEPDRLGADCQRRREASERRALDAVGPLGRRRLRRALAATRAAVRDRERMRLCRARMFGLFREVFLALGARLAEAGRLEKARDVFYLTMEEIEAYAEGRAVSADLASLVRARRAEFAAYEAQDLPHHFATRGPVYHGNRYEPPAGAAPAGQEATLTGIACCPGVAEAAARVVRSPRDDLSVSGRILVAERTDPGWTPLFPAAAGILVERGSVLSHSAVVAREFGVPAIVGIRGLTRLVADGERLRMDGGSGLVERLAAAP